MEKQRVMLIDTVPAVKELRKVPGFDPLRFLRKKASAETGATEVTLDLRYKRLWFRLACPNGRMLLNPLRITDQMAICEARVFLHRDDELPITNYTAEVLAKDAPGGDYVRAAQDQALNVALDNAGFGIQLCDVSGEPEHEPAPVTSVRSEDSQQPAAATEHAASMQQPNAAPTPAPAPTAEPAQAVTPAPVINRPEAAQEMPVTGRPAAENDAQAPAQEPGHAAPAGTTSDAMALFQTLTRQDDTPVPQADASAEEEPAPAGDAPAEAQPQYTEDMSVEEIRALMTSEEAGRMEVSFGICKGWTLAQVAEQRPASLKWLAYGCDSCGNILKAAALTMLGDVMQQKAG